MPAERRQGARGKGRWLAVVLLLVPGFALGAGAGLLWEEPRLLASYLLGGTEEVAWAPGEAGSVLVAAESPELPAVAAALEPAVPEPAVTEPRGPEPTAPARTRPPSPAGRFVVQVGAFAEKASAERLAGALRAKGYDVVIRGGEAGPGRWRVRVGPLGSREAGERAASRLEREEKLPTWVLEEAT